MKILREIAAAAGLAFCLSLATNSAVAATTEETNEELAYSIGVQAFPYGQPLMELYRTFYQSTLDSDRGHDRTLKEFNAARVLTTPKDTRVATWK